MDQKGRGRGRGGGAGGHEGGDNSRTDLLAAGRKKLHQFRKKKEKKGPGKKADADTDEGASSAAGANGEEPVSEPKSPVGLKFLAGEGGSTPFEEEARVQEEQCNGQGPATTEPSAAENADGVPALEDADSGSVQNASSISEQGNPEHGSPGLGFSC